MTDNQLQFGLFQWQLKWCLQYVCGMHSLKMYVKVNFSNVVSQTFLKAIHQHEQCLEA